jgi:uncharacterized protein YkwD
MVNKIAVILVGGIILVGVVVIGGVAALVLGDGGTAGTGTPGAVQPTALPTDIAGTATAATATAGGSTVTPTPTPTATATPTATPTPTPQPTVALSEFDHRRIEVLVARMINDRRAEQGLDRLATNSSVANRVRAMARNHSHMMSEEGKLSHTINGKNSTQRYRDNDLFTRCQWQAPGDEAIIKPNVNQFEGNQSALEAVEYAKAGRQYEDGGEKKFLRDDRAVARELVEGFWDDIRHRPRLLLDNARYLGVGVEKNQDGEVFVTANLC